MAVMAEKELDPQLSRVLHGDILNLPPVNSQIIRIFTSSTFTDTMQERNSLIEKVYPKIQQYCRSKYGLEFQVIDMRWGVTDDVTDDHQTAALCLREIENCQKMSAGPNFMAFLGQRHGFQPFPTEIDEEEFNLLMEQLTLLGMDVEVIKTWFLLDENAIPPVYMLQPISSRIPDFLSDDELRKKEARRDWNAVFGKMQMLLRRGAKACQEKGTLPEEVTSKYFKSVTETEIDQGIFNAPGDPNSQVLCFVRIIEDITSHLSDKRAARFIDMLESGLDEEAQTHLTHLRDQRLADAVTTLHRFKVTWKDVVDKSPRTNSDYLEQFTNLFEGAVIHMIDKSINFNEDLAHDETYSEVLQHLHMVKDRCQIFHGREDVLEEIKLVVKQNQQHPLIVYGHSGCGKTSVMTKCVQLSQHWLSGSNQKPVIVTRLLGTTPMSTNIIQVLASICRQIAVCYDVKDVEIPDEISGVALTLKKLLTNASAARPLCLILDSIDQLSCKENAYGLNWLPRKLPQHVTMIMSTLPEMHGLLDTLHKRYSTGTFIEIPSLGGNTSQEILNSWLLANKRQVTDDQMQMVQKAFSKCSLALYVKLVFDEVLTWHSYTPISEINLLTTIREVICHLFGKLRKRFGATFVDHTLGYITASKSGISEIEIEDMLSLDDVVLTDVFQYHIPPIRRIPQLLWLRLKNDINSYLVTREADGIRVIYWYHRQFIEAAESFFLGNVDNQQYLHQNMADYYLGTWHNKKKHFCYNEHQMKKLKLEDPYSSADRKVASQPLVFISNESSDDKITRHNIRKLNSLPHHIHHMNKDDLLRHECLYNYDWLYQKIKATSVQAVLSDFELLHVKTESDIYLSTVLRMSKATLNIEPSTLAIEISGSLLPNHHMSSYLKTLLDTCYIKGPYENALVPRQQCYNSPGGPCIHMLEHAALPAGEKSLVLTSDPALLGSLTRYTNTLLIWDIDEGELIQEVCLWQEEDPKFNVLEWNMDGDKFLCACAFQSTVNPIAIFDIKSEELQVIKIDKCYPRIGFIDSFKVDLHGDKILICVTGKECDCFDLNGHLLYSFDVQPISMHIHTDPHAGSELILFPSKTEPALMMYDLAGKEKYQVTRIGLTSIAKQMVVSDDMDIFVLYGDTDELDWLKRDRKGNYQTHDKVNILKDLKKPAKILELKSEEKHLFFITSEGIVWWKKSQKRIMHELYIPEKLKSPHRRVQPLTAHITSGKNLIFCAYDGNIIIWDLFHGKLLQTIKASLIPISDLLIGHCGGKNIVSDALITATSNYRTVGVWDVSQADMVNHQPLTMDNAGRYISLAEEANIAIFRGRDVREARIVDLVKGRFVTGFAAEHDSMHPLITSDGKYIIVRDFEMEQTIRIYSGEGALLHVLPKFSIYLKQHSNLGSNHLLVTHEELSPSEEFQTKVWDLRTGSLVQKMMANSGGINDMFFAKNDTLLVTHQLHPFTQLNEDTVIHVYDIASGKEIVTIPGLMPDSTLKPVPMSDHALAIMSPHLGEELEAFAIIDIASGNIIAKHYIRVHRQRSFNISANGKIAVDSELRVIDIYSGDIICDLGHFMGSVREVIVQLFPRVTVDGKFVIWAEASESLLKVVRIEDRKLIGVCYTHGQPASFAVSKDNIVVVSVSDGRVMFLSLLDTLEPTFESELVTLKEAAYLKDCQSSDKSRQLMSRSCMCSVL